MPRKIASYCVALFLTVTSVFAARRSLNCINDLKTCHEFDVSKILKLLHWFACEVDIDYDDTIQLTFDPNSRDYGCHYYENREGLLEYPPWGYHYYTIGNIHQAGSEPLPSYVVNSRRGNIAWNRARILISVNEGRQIDQVFITQHYDASEHQGSSYDPGQTFRITTAFLRQLRKRSIHEIQQLADGSQPGPSRNTTDAYFQQVQLVQEVRQPMQDTHTRIDMPYTTVRQDDCLQNPRAKICCLILVIIIIIFFIIALGSYFGIHGKY